MASTEYCVLEAEKLKRQNTIVIFKNLIYCQNRLQVFGLFLGVLCNPH